MPHTFRQGQFGNLFEFQLKRSEEVGAFLARRNSMLCYITPVGHPLVVYFIERCTEGRNPLKIPLSVVGGDALE